jgi:hypothetical protein
MSFMPTPSRRISRRAPPSLSLPFFVFIAYGEVSAARDAFDRVRQTLVGEKRDCEVQPMFWRFDQLGHPRWREMALHDAIRAHTMVLAMGGAPSLDRATDEWLTALVDRRAGVPINCLALMGEHDAWTISLQRSDAAAFAPRATAARKMAPAVSARAA